MLRQEWMDNKSQALIPYFGFDYQLLTGMDLYVKGNLARKYHLPSLNDLYWQPGGNPDLKPEDGMSYELGLDYHFKIQNLKLQTELTAFYSDINNWILWTPSFKGYWQPQNVRNVVAKGLEVNLNLKGRSGKISYVVVGNYAFTQSLNFGAPELWGDASYGKQLVFVPVHSGNIMLSLAWKKFHASWQHNSYSERFTTTTNDVSSRYRFYPYFMNDFIVGKEFQIGKIALSAEFKIYNIFDESYRSVLARPMPGRNYLFTLMLNY
jgi:iron complex outermembrane receptor protein